MPIPYTMPYDYEIEAYGPNPKIVVTGGTMNSEFQPIMLVGRSAKDYGYAFAVNQVRHLSNFARSTPPDGRWLVGMLWFDTSTMIVRVWNGSVWDDVANPNGSLVPPATTQEELVMKERTRRIAGVDLIISDPNKWNNINTTIQTEIHQYRKKLVDLTGQASFPYVTWPVASDQLLRMLGEI